jgi:hypothetical protein
VLISAVKKAGLSSLNEGAKVSYKEKENRGKTSGENQKSANRLASDRPPAGSCRQAKDTKQNPRRCGRPGHLRVDGSRLRGPGSRGKDLPKDQTVAIRIPQGDFTSSHLELETGGPWGNRVISRLRSPRDDLPFQGHFMIDDKVKIKCTKCSQVFRERAQKVRPNSQTNCAHCNRLITFEFGSDDPNIRRALSSAKEIRVVVEMELKARANADR